jgi:hypothetical protein
MKRQDKNVFGFSPIFGGGLKNVAHFYLSY